MSISPDVIINIIIVVVAMTVICWPTKRKYSKDWEIDLLKKRVDLLYEICERLDRRIDNLRNRIDSYGD